MLVKDGASDEIYKALSHFNYLDMHTNLKNRLLMLCLTVIKQNLEKISPLLSRNQNMDYLEGYSLGAVLDSDVTLVVYQTNQSSIELSLLDDLFQADDRGFGVWSVTMTIISEWWRRNGLNSLVEEKGRKDTTVDKYIIKE